MSKGIRHHGKLIYECSIRGELRQDGYFPGHINGLQIGRTRFLLLYTNRGWRGTDDNTSVIYQIREGAYDGPLVKEGRLAESIPDWSPLADGKKYVKGHVCPIAFGVPRGALIEGTVSPQAGVFVFIWLRQGRCVDPETGFLLQAGEDRRLTDGGRVVEWAQLRLNAAEDDLELVQPTRTLRQKGYENGYPFCELNVRRLTMSFMLPVPFNPGLDEWIGTGAFTTGSDSRVAAMKFRFSSETGLYEWTDTGPLSVEGLSESSVLPWRGSWVIAARVHVPKEATSGGPIAWIRTDDPFRSIPEPVYPESPLSRSPNGAFLCADGRVRLITNAPGISPYGQNRNPLYVWDIDPDGGFSSGEPTIVFDSVARGIPIREQSKPVVDQGKIFPHAGGRTQIIAHRLRPTSTNDPKKTGLVINESERSVCGIYYGSLDLDREYPGVWSFA